MSRIGKKPIPIPKGVSVDIKPGIVEVQGPKGKLTQPLPTGIGFSQPRIPYAIATLSTVRPARMIQ